MIKSVIYYTLLIVYLIVYGIFISIVWLLTILFDKKKRIIAWTTRYHARGMFWLNPCWKISIEGKEHIVPGKPYVIVSNHQAMFDIPLLHALDFNGRWIAKKELIKMPFVGHAMLVHGDILLERGDSSSAKTMLKRGMAELKKGVSICIFPEGTRSKTGRVNRFKDGAFVMAKFAKTEILPVAIEGTATAFKDGWKLVTPHTFYIRVLPPIDTQTVKENDVKTLAIMTHDLILAEHMKMRPDLYQGNEEK